MDNVLSFSRGRVPLLVSMPHPGTRLTPAVANGLVDEARELADTDWHIPRLYDFARELGVSTLAANYSRYVIDLNRPADDKPLYSTATTGLYPDTLFDGRPLFRDGQAPSAEECARYLAEVWTPYHRTLAEEPPADMLHRSRGGAWISTRRFSCLRLALLGRIELNRNGWRGLARKSGIDRASVGNRGMEKRDSHRGG